MTGRKILAQTGAALLLLLGGGCASVHSSGHFNNVRTGRGETPLATLEVENTGWFLFNCFPVACGDTRFPNETSCRFFQDTVTLQNNLDMLTREMARRHSHRFENLSSRWTSEKFLFLLLTRHGYHTSAVLLADEKETK